LGGIDQNVGSESNDSILCSLFKTAQLRTIDSLGA